MKIQGFSNNNYMEFSGLFKTKKKKSSNDDEQKRHDNFIFLDTHLLDYGIPKKAAFVQDNQYAFTTVMLYDGKNRCYLSEQMSDEEAEAAEILLEANGLGQYDIVHLVDIKGGIEPGAGKETALRPKNPGNSSKFMINIDSLNTKDRIAVLKALYGVEQKEKEARTYLRCPAILDNSSDKRTMSYPTFLARTFGSGFYMSPVLNNLNISTRNAFKEEDIDRVSVSKDGMQMRIQTKDGKRANLNFNDGSRCVYDSDIDDSGFGTLMIMDKNGPVIRSY